MRFVFEIDGKHPQVGGGGKSYSTSTNGGLPEYHGFRLDLVICDSDGDGHEGDVFHLEGNGESIRQIARDILDIADLMEESCREQVVEERARARQCQRCGRWHDPRFEWHGDGRGNRCEWGREGEPPLPPEAPETPDEVAEPAPETPSGRTGE